MQDFDRKCRFQVEREFHAPAVDECVDGVAAHPQRHGAFDAAFRESDLAELLAHGFAVDEERRADVAQQLLRRAAGGIHQAQVRLGVPVHERVAHERHARVLLKKVRRAVIGKARLPVGIEIRRIDLRERLGAEAPRHAAHIGRQRRIRRRQPRVAAAGVRQAQREAHVGKRRRDRGDLPGGEVDVHRAVERASELIHEAGRLAEVAVFRLLAEARELLGRERAAVVERVEDAADEDLKRGRRRQAAARLERGGRPRLEAADSTAGVQNGRRHAAHERPRLAIRAWIHGQIVERDRERPVSLRVDAHAAVTPARRTRGDAHVHGGRQHAAELMIGMVSGQLRAAGGKKSLHDLPPKKAGRRPACRLPCKKLSACARAPARCRARRRPRPHRTWPAGRCTCRSR